LRQYQEYGANVLFSNDLTLAEAYLDYYANDRARGLELLNGLQAGSELRGAFFNRLLGLWYLQNNAPRLAVNRFDRAIALEDTTMRINRGIALAEGGLFAESLPVWQAEKFSSDPQARALARRMEAVTRRLAGLAADSTDDAGKVMLVHLSRNNPQASVPATVGDAPYRGLAYAELAEVYLTTNQVDRATEAYRAASELLPDSPVVKELALKLLAAGGQCQKLLSALNEPLPAGEVRNRKPYWEALCYENTSKAAQAAKQYDQAVRRLPLDPQVITNAAAFYQSRQKDNDRAYNILVEAIRLNPYAPAVHKAYIRQALEMGLTDYAEKGLEEFRLVTTATDYGAFLPEYKAQRASVEKRLSEWQ
jgi:tetratricopeptide (TPR) repeat protein